MNWRMFGQKKIVELIRKILKSKNLVTESKSCDSFSTSRSQLQRYVYIYIYILKKYISYYNFTESRYYIDPDLDLLSCNTNSKKYIITKIPRPILLSRPEFHPRKTKFRFIRDTCSSSSSSSLDRWNRES